MAHVATIAILQQNPVSNNTILMPRLQAAVTSRGVLEMAMGVLAEVHGLDMGEAFARLRCYGREHDQHLSDVARTVVSGAPELRRDLLAQLGSTSASARNTPSH